MKNEKFTKRLFLMIICLVLLVILTRGITYAKYISNAVFNYYLETHDFYFESDELTLETAKITDTSWDGEKVTFNLKNSSNQFIASSTDIEYKVTCIIEEENTTKECYLNGTTSSTVTGTLSASLGCLNETDDGVDTTSYTEDKCLSSNYTWTNKPTKTEHYFEVVDKEKNEVNNATVLITAESTSPYTKTISSKYILTKDSSDIGTLTLEHESYSSYENVIITNSYNEDKCLKLSWNADDLIFDTNSNDIISSEVNENNYINSIVFKVLKKDSINYIFYKNNQEKTYSETDFALVETNNCE